MKIMHRLRKIVLLPLTLAAFSVSAAESATEAGAIAELLNSGEISELDIKRIVAEKFSNHVKFLDISYVEPNEEGQEGGWNTKYNFKYGTSGGSGFGYRDGRAVLEAFAAELDINGSYSYGDAFNTDDLSTVNFSLAYLQGDFGAVTPITRAESDAYQGCVAEIDVNDPDFAEKDILCWKEHKIDDLVIDAHRSYAFSIDMHVLVEGNQNFSSTNTAYGVQGLVSAEGYPSFRLDIERVDASENDTRKAITTEDDFDRISAEIGYRYAFRTGNGMPISLFLSYRHFHEISAPAEIEAADLDSFGYSAISVRFPALLFGLPAEPDFNLFIRYTDGQLPFDRQDDQAIEIGFSTNIAVLGELFD